MITMLNENEIQHVSGGDGSLTEYVMVAHVNSNGDTYYVGTWMSVVDATFYRARDSRSTA